MKSRKTDNIESFFEFPAVSLIYTSHQEVHYIHMVRKYDSGSQPITFYSTPYPIPSFSNSLNYPISPTFRFFFFLFFLFDVLCRSTPSSLLLIILFLLLIVIPIHIYILYTTHFLKLLNLIQSKIIIYILHQICIIIWIW